MPSVGHHGQPTPSHRLRAQINHLLPRHSYFRARVHIHQVSSVPFVGGEFAVRWKFKGAQAAGARHGLLEIVKARPTSVACKRSNSLRREDGGSGTFGGHKQEMEKERVKGSGVLLFSGDSENSGGSFSAPGTSDTSVASSSSTSTIFGNSILEYSPLPSPSPHTTLDISPPDTHMPDTAPDDGPSTARGRTPFLPLHEHAVHWSHTLSTVLKIDVDRDTSLLLPSPLKLVIIQRVIPDDPAGAPQNPRLGAVYLNLAEYVGRGSVERRYLLRESRTNATLKLTITVTHVSGTSNYRVPPLAKGEILTGIAGFLDNDVYLSRRCALNLYGPYRNQEELDMDLLGVTTGEPAEENSSQVHRDGGGDAEAYSYESSSGTDLSAHSQTPTRAHTPHLAFDVHRLPIAYGTRTTEALIDALFNPVKTTEKGRGNPFTAEADEDEHSTGERQAVGTGREDSRTRAAEAGSSRIVGLGLGADMRARIFGEAASMYSSETGSSSASGAKEPSMHTSSSSSSSPGGSAAVSRRASANVLGIPSRSSSQNRSQAGDEGHQREAAGVGGGLKSWWKRVVVEPSVLGS